MSGAGVIVLMLLIGIAGAFVPWLLRRRVHAAVRARDSLDDDQVYSRYFANSGCSRELVRELWLEVAETLKVDPKKLRPGDRFGKEVGPFWITSEELDALATKGRERAESLGLQIDFGKLKTVDEYVRALARR